MDVIVKDTKVEVPEKPLLGYRQREELKAEINQIDEALSPHNPYSHLRRNSIDVQEAGSRARRLKKQLADYSPPESLPGPTKDALYKRSKELEGKILEGMPSNIFVNNCPTPNHCSSTNSDTWQNGTGCA